MKKLTSVLLLFFCHAAYAEQQHIYRLPQPSGPFAIGRRTLTAQRRGASGKRLIEIGLWYPECEPGQLPPAPYLSLVPVDHSALAKYLPPSGQILTHAHENAKPCKQSGPLLLFSPGLGVSIYGYSAQFEELASLGYTVAAVQHPDEGVELHLPKGKVIPAAAAGGRVMQITQQDVDTLVADLHKALAVVTAKQKSLGWQTFTKIGVFGHSIGGVVALRTCQVDRRVAACLSDDGLYERRPFFSVRVSLTQPFLVLAESNPGLTDEAIASTHLTRAGFVAQEMEPRGTTLKMYEASQVAGYLVIVATPDVTHMSFTDFPLLDSQASSGSELRTFQIIMGTTENFFNSYLRMEPTTPFALHSASDVAVFSFAPASQ
jgi:pimeloyl-ACP methyl ester carboxylesterase